MEVKTYTIDEIKNIVTPIAEKYQIAQVYLFGYFARGDEFLESIKRDEVMLYAGQ